MDDPFSSLIDDCHCSDSQTDLLNRTRFAREGDFRSSSPSSSPPTPPSTAQGTTTPSAKDEDDTPTEELYKTPPEETRLLFSSSQEQPQLSATAASVASTFVDSSKFDGSFGLSPRITEEEEVTSILLDRGVDASPQVNLRFVKGNGAKMVEVVDEGKVMVREVLSSELKRFLVREREEEGLCDLRSNDSSKKKLKSFDGEGGDLCFLGAEVSRCDDGNPLRVTPLRRLPSENAPDTEEMMIETKSSSEEGDELCEVLDDEVCSVKKKLKFRERDEGDYDEDLVIGGGTEDICSDGMGDYCDGPLGLASADIVKNNVEEVEKLAVAGEIEKGNEDVHRGRGEVAHETREGKLIKNLDSEEAIVICDGVISSMLQALKVLAERMPCNQASNVDIFETAKCHGLKFPRPRWWSNGFDDEV